MQLGADVPGTLTALDRMLDATLKAKPDPFNLHAVMHCYLVHREKFTPAMTAKVKRLAASWAYSKPIGVSLNYGEINPDVGANIDSWGMAANYDLGGGAKVMFGYASDVSAAATDDDQWSLGLGMSF